MINNKIAISVLVLVGVALSSAPADAAPVTRLGLSSYAPFVLGLDGEVSLPGTQFGAIGNATWINGIGYWATVTGRYTLMESPDSSFGLLLGLNQTWAYPTQTPNMVFQEIGHAALGSVLGAQELKMLAGIYFEHTWDRVRIRLSPALSFPAPFTGTYRTPFYNLAEVGLIGPAWVELGYKVTPTLEVGLKSNATPISLSMTF